MNQIPNTEYVHLTLPSGSSILDALKQMDALARKLLMVCDDGVLNGLVSIGDIQRAILNNIQLDTNVEKIMRTNIIVASDSDSPEDIKALMLKNRAEYMPVLNQNKKIVRLVFWEDLIDEKMPLAKGKMNLPVVIMAGGKGTRMKPLTNVIPKPLIPMGEKTIIETIIDQFMDAGCDDFHLSVNYKAEIIKHYFEQLNHPAYKLSYFQEEKPLGTVGSLYLLKGKITKTFFISNCDIIINTDYADILDYHNEQGNELTIVSALKHYPIPYGAVETGENGVLVKLTEKPEIIYQINSGMYILEPHLLDEIPDNKFLFSDNLYTQTILPVRKLFLIFPMSISL